MARFADLIETEIQPGPKAQTLAEIADAIGRGSCSHHANGSLQIGAAADANAVLDSEFRVRGTTGLRVIDTSAFPHNMGAFGYVDRRIEEVLAGLSVKAKRARYVGRPEAASPATGYLKVHNREQEALVSEALAA